MDEQKSDDSGQIDHEMDVGECSSEGEEEGEDDEGDLDEEIESIVDEESEEIADEEDDTIDDSVSLTSENFIGNSSSQQATPTYDESSFQSFKELEFSLCDESNGQDISDRIKTLNSQLEIFSQTKTTMTSAIGMSSGEPKFSVKLTRCKIPEKLCCLCNLSERSQLGQGELLKFKKPDSFVEEKSPDTGIVPSVDSFKEKEAIVGKNKKSAVRSNPYEPIDEHSIIGHADRINISDLFDEEDYLYIHLYCALFSRQITRNTNSELENVVSCVSKSLTRLCSHCNRYGANITCSFNNCDKTYHYPCSAASAGFQHLKTFSFICNTHIDHVPLLPTFNEVSCHTCFSLGDVSNLLMCSVCGNHHHGLCLGLALLSGVRTGWQCSDCRSCQICHDSDESSKIMLCDVCDKAYHATCLRPVLTSIPKIGWKCQCCRICSDCGSRTPGAGLSSRWHCHFTVCDSCYQQRNKGFSCPICHRAYRAGSSKDMSQCTSCKKFVHGTCDPEADPVTYQKKLESRSDYQYVCPTCKNMHQFEKVALKRKDSFEDNSVEYTLNTSQESITSDDMEVDTTEKEDCKVTGAIGLGKGKPFTARKKLTLSTVKGFRSKFTGKTALLPSVYQKKNQKNTDFGRKKYTKTKMRGVFGAPSSGLQRPNSDSQSKSDSENGENKIILCSAIDEFVLSQDICVMCGALGTDQEGCLIACVQCGQCYHPYCVNIKVTKVILQKGWRCLDCTVCEGCGQRTDEARLILCDDCDISYHIYCMEPKLDAVPRGTWKCKRCVRCLTCGANEPGVNCHWKKNYTECAPCASRIACPSCQQSYTEGDLIIKCENCERWLHGLCDQIKNEYDAEKCAIEGYTCIMCRPKDTPPAHLLAPPRTPPAYDTPKLKICPISPIKTPDLFKDDAEHFIDGTYLSENGLSHMTSLLNRIDTNVFSLRKKKRINTPEQGEQGILDSIESVIAAGVQGSPSAIIYKEGMIVELREDGKPPEAPDGFNICTNEAGVMVLKKKRIRKIGVGGFNARPRTAKKDKADDDNNEVSFYNDESVMSSSDDKPRKKNRYRKPKSKYAESYPSYIQDAFFGRELLDTSKDTTQDLDSSYSDSDELSTSRKITSAETVTLSNDELIIMEKVNAKREEMEEEARKREEQVFKMETIKVENVESEDKAESADNDNETFKDILNMSDNLLDTIMNEDETQSKADTSMMSDASIRSETETNSDNQKDEFSDILGPNFNLESMVNETGLPNMDGKDVEEIFKDVLTDESQNSHDSIISHTNVSTVSSSSFALNGNATVINQNIVPMSPSHAVIQNTMNMTPSQTSQLLQSPQSIPETPIATPAKQRTSQKMESDESLGDKATISSVLYANKEHPELKIEYPAWSDRCRQILKKWRALPADKKAPYLVLARENRTKLTRERKTSQIKDDNISESNAVEPASPNYSTRIVPDTELDQAEDLFRPLLTLNESKTEDQSRISRSPRSSTPNNVTFVKSERIDDDGSPKHTDEGQQTVTKMIPSHPSTIQYIPIITPTQADTSLRTVHLIPAVSTQSDTTEGNARSVKYQYVTAQHNRNTIHYPPNNVQIIQTGSSLIMSSNSLITAIQSVSESVNQNGKVIQIIPSTQNQTRNIQVMSLASERNENTEIDQNIRVLTPSEIMKTLPSLGQESFENTEQEKVVCHAQKVKETEQEKHWKQMQTLRQQQVTQHQMHDSRMQMHHIQQSQQPQINQMAGSGDQNALFATGAVPENKILQVATPQDAMSPSMTSPRPQRFAPAMKLPSNYQRVADGFTPTGTPRSQYFVGTPNTPVQANRQRDELFNVVNFNPDMTRQLRELLQKQQMDNTSEQPARIWVQESPNQHMVNENTGQGEQIQNNMQNQIFDSQNIGMSQFRSPLPPSQLRSRLNPQVGPQVLARQKMPAQQMTDSRYRLLMQQQQFLQQQQIQQQMMQQQLQQQQLQQFQLQAQPQIQIAATSNQRVPVSPSQPKSSPLSDAQLSEQAQNILLGNAVKNEFPQFVARDEESVDGSVNKTGNEKTDSQHDGLPESVTADLDELERDGALFGELMEDELLAEMGAGFNILEYADPELDSFTNGENSNILYDLVNNTSDSTKIKEEEDSNSKSIKNEEKSIEQDYPGASKIKTESKNTPQGQNQSLPSPQRVQLQRLNIREGVNSHLANLNSPGTPTQHPSPTGSQRSLQPSPAPMTPRPSSAITPGTPSPLPTPTTPHSQEMVQSPVTNEIQTQLPVPTPPPPPPYPGPPPPYPSQLKQIPQQVHHLGASPTNGAGNVKLSHGQVTAGTSQRRPLLLQEQPLLLEELLEQERREQEKREHEKQTMSPGNSISSALPPLSDADFERLRADVLNSGNMQHTLMTSSPATQANVKLRSGGNVYEVSQQPMWQQSAGNMQLGNASAVQVNQLNVASNETGPNTMINATQQKTPNVNIMNRVTATSVVTQSQAGEIVHAETLQGTGQPVTSQVRPGFRTQEQIVRYPTQPVRFLQSMRPRAGGMTFQPPGDGVRPAARLQGIRSTFKTQPLIVSAVGAAPTGSMITSTANTSMVNVFQNNGSDKEIRMQTIQQLTPDQRLIIQQHQLNPRSTLMQQSPEVSALAARQKRLIQQRQMMGQLSTIHQQLENANLAANVRQTLVQQKETLIKQMKELQQQSELTPQQKQQLIAVAHRQHMLLQQQKAQQQVIGANKQDQTVPGQSQPISQNQTSQQMIQQNQMMMQQQQRNQMMQQQNQMMQQQQNQIMHQQNQMLLQPNQVQHQNQLMQPHPNQQQNQMQQQKQIMQQHQQKQMIQQQQLQQNQIIQQQQQQNQMIQQQQQHQNQQQQQLSQAMNQQQHNQLIQQRHQNQILQQQQQHQNQILHQQHQSQILQQQQQQQNQNQMLQQQQQQNQNQILQQQQQQNQNQMLQQQQQQNQNQMLQQQQQQNQNQMLQQQQQQNQNQMLQQQQQQNQNQILQQQQQQQNQNQILQQQQQQNQNQMLQQQQNQIMQQQQNQMIHQQNQMLQQNQMMQQKHATSPVTMQQKHIPPRSPVNQHVNQYLAHSPASNQLPFNQPMHSPMQPQSPQQFAQSPQHFSQPHSNSSAPPASPMYNSSAPPASPMYNQ